MMHLLHQKEHTIADWAAANAPLETGDPVSEAFPTKIAGIVGPGTDGTGPFDSADLEGRSAHGDGEE